MRRTPDTAVWEEVTYLAFHLHWSLDDLLDLSHRDRRQIIRLVAGLTEREGGSHGD